MDQSLTNSIHEAMWGGIYALSALLYLLLFIYKRPSYVAMRNRWRYNLQHHEMNKLAKGLTSYAGDSALVARAMKIWPMAMLFVALMLVAIASNIAQRQLSMIIEWQPQLWFPIIYIGLMIISLYQWLVLYLVGFITGDYDLSRELFNLRYQNLSEWFVALSPLLLLQFIYFEGSNLISTATFIVLICCYLAHLWYTFLIFAIQKISIVNWFLYLCAVDLLPISLICALYIKQIY